MVARVRRRAAAAALIFGLLAGVVTPASAWSPAGHMALGAVAYHELARIDPEALEAVLETLRQHPHHGELLDTAEDQTLSAEARRIALFMRAARWPDDVRRAPYDEYHQGSWHYVNYHYRPGEGLTPPRGERDGLLLWALEENVRRLESDSGSVRAIAVAWLFHLVTDVHQPLHNIALVDEARPEGDRGGNLTWVREAEGDETITLHWFWDGLIHGDEAPSTALRKAHGLMHTMELSPLPAGPRGLAERFRSWSEEGARAAIDYAHQGGALPQGEREAGAMLPEGYRHAALEVAEARGILAARRLAQLLSELF